MVRQSRGLLLIRHQDFIGFDAGDGFELAVGDRFAERGYLAEVLVRGAAAEKFLMKLLAHDVSGVLYDRVELACTVHAGRENGDKVLAALRELGHAALAVGQLQLKFAHGVGDFERHAL